MVYETKSGVRKMAVSSEGIGFVKTSWLPLVTARSSRWTFTHRLDIGSDLTPDNPDNNLGGYEEYEYRPSVSIASGLWSAGVPFVLPSEQRVDEIYSANYTSEPLEIIGMGKAVVHVSSTGPVVAFVARLSDVAPDDTSAQMTIGVLNGTRRNSLTDPEPMKPGVDTSADVRSTEDAIHVSIGLDVRINGLLHRQRRWVESFRRELL